MRITVPRIALAYGTRDYANPNRATTRVTVQAVELGLYPVGNQTYSSIVFPNALGGAMELPNLKNVSWQRSADTEVSTCNITLFNAFPDQPGDLPPQGDMYDQLGYFTYNRGMTSAAGVWGQVPNEWRDMLVPDRLIRVYQGYGYNYDLPPESDDNVILMGCYLIDEVVYTAAGEITIACRDFGRMLLEQISFPPVIPLESYPLAFESVHEGIPDNVIPFNDFVEVVRRLLAYGGFYWPPNATQRLTGDHSVDVPFHSAPDPITNGVGTVYGFIDPSNAPNFPVSPPVTTTATLSGDVTFAVDSSTLSSAGQAAIANIINQATGDNPRISVVGHTDSSGSVSYNQGLSERRAASVRSYMLTLKPGASITATGLGETHPVATNATAEGRQQNRRVEITYTTDTTVPAGPQDFAAFGVEVFNLKPLMDGIIAVRDTLGFIFYVNEEGSPVFRLPNIFKRGNIIMQLGGEYAQRVDRTIALLDTEVILQQQSKLSSHNTRERVVVANSGGGLASTAYGRVQIPVNFRRVSIYSDQNFERQQDVAVMADMIALRQLFTYRTNTLRIPANVEIQVDDQIQISERVTGENYIHYVSAISSEWDAESGRWTYDLTTTWLGTDPETEWAFESSGLSAETQAFLDAVNQL